MTMEPTVNCPSCHTQIKLTESLAAPLLEATRKEYEQKLIRQGAEFAQREEVLKSREAELSRQKDDLNATIEQKLRAEREKMAADAARQEAALAKKQAELTKERESIDAAVAEKMKAERQVIAADEARKARLVLGDDLERKSQEVVDLNERVKVQNEKLAEALKLQAETLRKQRELEDKEREMDVTVEKRVTESIGQVRQSAQQAARKEAEEQWSLKVVEKQTTIESMQRKIEDLQKKAEQGSQQLQGEALELQLEAMLTQRFPHDRVAPVPKGEHGGDILQHVMTPAGVACGTILWESKRARNWQKDWLPKLRQDQRQAKAEAAILVSTTLPDGLESFDQVDGVWVVDPRCALPVAMAVRNLLCEVHDARQAGQGQQTKMEMIYQYCTSPRFRLRVSGLVEAFNAMQEDLAKERKAIQKQWAKRQTQIDHLVEATAGMWGDLQGIAGKTIAEIDGLELPGAPDATALPA